MQIKNILSALSDTARLGQNREAAEAAARKAMETPAANPATDSSRQARLRDILAGYDVTSITPRAFSALLHELQQAGVLPDEDLQNLFQIRADLDREDIAPDQRVNLVEMYAKRVREAEQDAAWLEEKVGAASAQAWTASLRRRLEWLQKFAAIHASPDGTAVNTWA